MQRAPKGRNAQAMAKALEKAEAAAKAKREEELRYTVKPVGMRIKLIRDICVGAEHGLVKGLELDVAEFHDGEVRGSTWFWVVSPKSGERVKVLKYEAEVLVWGTVEG